MSKNNNICDLKDLKDWIIKLIKKAVKKYLNTNNVKVTVSLSNRVIITVRYNSNVDTSKISYLYDLNNDSNGFFVFKPINKDIIQRDISFKHISIGFYPNENRNNLFYKIGQLIGMFNNDNGVTYINSAILDFKERDKNKQTFILSLNKNNWYNRDINTSDLKLLSNNDLKTLDKIAIKHKIKYPLRYTMFIKNSWINKINNPVEDRYLKKDTRYCSIIKDELIKIINIKKDNSEPLDIYNIKDYKVLDYEQDFYRSFEDLSVYYEELGLKPFKISYDNDFSNLNSSTKRDKELIRLVYSLH